MRDPFIPVVLMLAAIAGCRELPDQHDSLAVARFPPVAFGETFRTGRGVYASESSYRIFLDHDGLVPSARTQITPEIFSVLILIGTSKSRYEGRQANEPEPRLVRAHDGATLYVQSWPELKIVGASRIFGGDTDITYLVHHSRLAELVQMDRQVTEKLSIPR